MLKNARPNKPTFPTSGNRAMALPSLMLLLLCACTSQTDAPVPKPQNTYFSIKQFFEGEIERLTKEAVSSDITIEMNGKSETQKNEKVDWRTQLAPFLVSDINKPAWIGKYSVDTTKTNGKTTLTFTAREAKLRTRSIAIVFENGEQPSSISIQNEVSNLVYAQKERLNYSKTAYSIESEQRMLWMKPKQFIINARFGGR